MGGYAARFLPPSPDGAPPEDSGSKRLPWENKARYIIGSGELGLLNELQLPRRGAVVTLAPGFLRLPLSPIVSLEPDSKVEDDGTGTPPTVEPLIYLDDDGGTGPAQLSPIVPPSRGRVLKDGGSVSHIDKVVGRGTTLLEAAARAGAPRPHSLKGPYSTSMNARLQQQKRGRDDVRADNGAGKTREPYPKRGDVERESTRTNSKPEVGGGKTRRGRRVALRNAGGDSSADRIAAYRPGTKFHVAVDKGVTGLGITVKELNGRFFVYGLQMLADGSPGSAEVSASRRVASRRLGI